MRLQQYRLFQHHGTFYVENVGTKKQESLRTKSKPEALVLLAAKNEADVVQIRDINGKVVKSIEKNRNT